MGGGTGTCFYQAKPITAREIANIFSALPRNFAVEEAIAYKRYDPIRFKSALKEMPLVAELIGKYGGVIDIRNEDLYVTLQFSKQEAPMERDILLVKAVAEHSFDIGFAVSRWNHENESAAEQMLKNNTGYIDLITAILNSIGNEILFGTGDQYYHVHEYEGCYPQCVTHNHWIQFYGAPLLDDEITRLLLETPAYFAKKIGGGVLLVSAPTAWGHLPFADDVAGQPQEIQDLVKYRNQGIIIEAYFKQHDLHEKLRKKAEEFSKQTKEQKGETE